MDEVADYREKNQPIRERTGGSTFKNPPGNSAWKLIDEAGCRGLRVGGAKVSEMHCNFLINDAGATAEDIERLGETVRARVKARSGISLQWEIIRLGLPLPGCPTGEALRRPNSYDLDKAPRAHARPRRRADGRLVGRARGQPAVGRRRRRGAGARGLSRHADRRRPRPGAQAAES